MGSATKTQSTLAGFVHSKCFPYGSHNSAANDELTGHRGLEKFPKAMHSVTTEVGFDLPEPS